MSRPIGTALKLPEKIALSAKVPLNRSLIAVNGPDARHFLNGLLTVQPDKDQGIQSGPQYCGLLNAKGRFMADMMLYRADGNALLEKHLTKAPGHQNYILEVDSKLCETIMFLLNFYKLQSDVNLGLVNSLKSLATWDDLAETPTAQLPSQKTCISSFDPRIPELGARHLYEEGTLQDGEYQTEQDYALRRYLFGIPEGSEEILPKKSLPLECNLDYLHGVDFKKGCYVGQELTIRSHHNNTVRKRIVPVVLAKPDSEPDFDDPYSPDRITAPDAAAENIGVSNQEGKSAGNLVALIGNIGLATVRLSSLDQQLEMNGLAVNGVVQPQSVYAMAPFWWPAPEPQGQS